MGSGLVARVAEGVAGGHISSVARKVEEKIAQFIKNPKDLHHRIFKVQKYRYQRTKVFKFHALNWFTTGFSADFVISPKGSLK